MAQQFATAQGVTQAVALAIAAQNGEALAAALTSDLGKETGERGMLAVPEVRSRRSSTRRSWRC